MWWSITWQVINPHSQSEGWRQKWAIIPCHAHLSNSSAILILLLMLWVHHTPLCSLFWDAFSFCNYHISLKKHACLNKCTSPSGFLVKHQTKQVKECIPDMGNNKRIWIWRWSIYKLSIVYLSIKTSINATILAEYSSEITKTIRVNRVVRSPAVYGFSRRTIMKNTSAVSHWKHQLTHLFIGQSKD